MEIIDAENLEILSYSVLISCKYFLTSLSNHLEKNSWFIARQNEIRWLKKAS